MSVADGSIAAVDTVDVLGPAAARRAALAAQGFADARPDGVVTRRHLARLLTRIRLLQLDSVNVAVRAHYMPVFSRLGPYDPGLVDDAAWTHSARRPRLLVEYWAHEASLLPVADWPLLLSGAKRAGWWRHYEALADREPQLVDDLLAAVKELGPVGAGALETALGAGAARPKGASWWARSDVKRICEYLFGTGALTTGARVHFQRLYDLPERVLPPEVLAAHPADPDVSARALGGAGRRVRWGWPRSRTCATTTGSGRRTRSQARSPSSLEEGALERVAVRGWRHPGVPAHRAARIPAPDPTARALLSPFDPLIWERARTERIFGFRYRIEIYVPEPQREYGYYVFPFLLDDALVARVDLKADRVAGVLRVPGAFGEPPGSSVVAADRPRVVAELAAALRELAAWQGLDGVVVGERGDLAAPLTAQLR